MSPRPRGGLGSNAFGEEAEQRSSILDTVAPLPPEAAEVEGQPATPVGRKRQDVVRIDSDAVQLARNLVHFLMVQGETSATLSSVMRDAVLAYVETMKQQLNGGEDFPTRQEELRRGRRPTFGS